MIVVVAMRAVMNGMHRWRHPYAADDGIDARGQADIGMFDQAPRRQPRLEREDGGEADAEQQHQQTLVEHRYQRLARMEAHAGGDVEPLVGVMQPVQRPAPGQDVKSAVLPIDRKVEQQDGKDHFQPERHNHQVEQPGALPLRPQRRRCRCRNREQPDQRHIGEAEDDVDRPASALRTAHRSPGFGERQQHEQGDKQHGDERHGRHGATMAAQGRDANG